MFFLYSIFHLQMIRELSVEMIQFSLYTKSVIVANVFDSIELELTIIKFWMDYIHYCLSSSNTYILLNFAVM